MLPMIFRKVDPGKVLKNLEVTNVDFQPTSGNNDPIFHPFVLRFSEAVETVAQRCSIRKVFLEISQVSQENTCARVSFLIKLQACI